MTRISPYCLASLFTLACATPADPEPMVLPGASTSSDASASPGTSGGSDATPTTSSSSSSSASTANDTGEPLACDPVRQDCPAGRKCSGVKPTLKGPYTGTACVPDNANGGSPLGSICVDGPDGSDTCGPDSMCVQFGSGEGACVPFCTGTVDDPTCADPLLRPGRGPTRPRERRRLRGPLSDPITCGGCCC